MATANDEGSPSSKTPPEAGANEVGEESKSLTEDQIQHLKSSKFTVKTRLTHIFFDEPFQVEIYLTSDRNDLQKVSNQLKISIKDDSGEEFTQDSDAIETDPAEVELTDGAGKFSLKVTEKASLIGNKIHVHVSSVFGDCVVTGTSNVLVLCKASLSLVKEPPTKWFKDEGGKGNCIELQVKLQEEGSMLFGDKDQVPLNACLLYEDGNVVSQQGILQMARDAQLTTNSEGISTLKFRVSEVSQRHQGQNFRIRIQPNTNLQPTLTNIAPATSRPFTVLSKRKKKEKEREEREAFEQQFRGAPPAFPAFMAAGGAPPFPGPGGAFRQEADDDDPELGPPSAKKPRTGAPGGPLAPAPFRMASGAPPPAAAFMAAVAGPPLAPAPAATAPPSEAMGAALDGVLKWVGLVLDLVQKLQWEMVGYEMGRNMEPDTTRPLFRCPSCRRYREGGMPASSARHAPSCEIAQVLLEYSTQTMNLFQVLANQLCGPGPAADPAAAAAAAA
eukprot:CAMPEP_0206386634 /NCGR_PEP_ID=MMETSP0294-20121207/16070_1 /ASSEMBLY_ACC=CAM_ASM_000327 /TAXON_ID=39354 /ORGANISM="Heterosigma akashiwo, Strain CCMP2393" /LENGTH=501 /DNA_ID=CAMNT_0053837739 /DNA_START=52 /DNA_END=1553 /DNA_ORIENTATION=-